MNTPIYPKEYIISAIYEDPIPLPFKYCFPITKYDKACANENPFIAFSTVFPPYTAIFNILPIGLLASTDKVDPIKYNFPFGKFAPYSIYLFITLILTPC